MSLAIVHNTEAQYLLMGVVKREHFRQMDFSEGMPLTMDNLHLIEIWVDERLYF